MLILNLQQGKYEDEVIIEVGEEKIIVKLLSIRTRKARLGFEATKSVKINRRGTIDRQENESPSS